MFFLSLVILTGMILIGGIVREAMSHGLPPAQILRLIPYILPDALRYSVPVTLLLATTSVYARMSSSNEVVAVKSLGISPSVILWPTIITSFLLSLGAVWLNDVAVSWGRSGVQRVVVGAAEEIAYGMLRTHRRHSASGFSINVKRVEDRTLIRPTVSLKVRDDSPPMTVTAEQAELRSDHKNNLLRIIFRNGEVEVAGRVQFRFPGEREYQIPLKGAGEVDLSTLQPSWLPLRIIPGEIANQKSEIRRHEEEMAIRASQQMLCGDFDDLTSREWNTRRRTLENKRARLFRLRTEPQRRWSAGFSCLCFVLVGAPAAILLRNRDFLTSFFLCFAPILIVYYPLWALALDASKSGWVHPLWVWAGNVALVLCGVYLMRKVVRH